MASSVQVVLDEVDVTPFSVEGSVTWRLSRVSQATVKINMKALDEVFGLSIPDAGSFLKIYLIIDSEPDPVLYHHGRVMSREVTADENTGYAVFNSSDPLELWTHRPVRDDDGDFTNPTLIDTYTYGPEIVQAMLNNSATAGAGPPSDAEGPTRLFIHSIATGITPLASGPLDWPMTMAEFASLLISTNTVDLLVEPIEFDGDGNYGNLTIGGGNLGRDLTPYPDYHLQYGMGARNVKSLRWNSDMSDVCNKLWYYLGPRKATPSDYQGNQHWAANITGDDPGLAYPPGGATSPPHSATDNQVGVLRYQSQQDLDVRMEVKIFDGNASLGKEMWRRLWQEESYLRAQPRTLVHVTPVRDHLIGLLMPGDLISVEATSDVAGGFSGAQRIYEFTTSWGQDSVPAISELQVSSDQQGFS